MSSVCTNDSWWRKAGRTNPGILLLKCHLPSRLLHLRIRKRRPLRYKLQHMISPVSFSLHSLSKALNDILQNHLCHGCVTCNSLVWHSNSKLNANKVDDYNSFINKIREFSVSIMQVTQLLYGWKINNKIFYEKLTNKFSNIQIKISVSQLQSIKEKRLQLSIRQQFDFSRVLRVCISGERVDITLNVRSARDEWNFGFNISQHVKDSPSDFIQTANSFS